MAGAHGVAAKVFQALGSAGVNVRAIAQGASERNISVVIDGKGSARALRAVHSSFYLSAHTISIGLIGPGLVGSSLLEQIASQAARLERDFKLDLRIRAIAGIEVDAPRAGRDRPARAGATNTAPAATRSTSTGSRTTCTRITSRTR